MNNEININTFKITRDGRYDHKANITMKLRNKLPAIEKAIDNFFTNH